MGETQPCTSGTLAYDPLRQHTMAIQGLTDQNYLYREEGGNNFEALLLAIVRDGVLVAEESVDALRARAGRRIGLRWGDGYPTDGTTSPPFLQVEKREGRDWQCVLSGSIQQFVQWAATQPLDDLTIGPPDLDTVFRRFYQRKRIEE